jgi:hypothetical protein
MEPPTVAPAFAAWMDKQGPNVSIARIPHGEAYYLAVLFNDPAAAVNLDGVCIIGFRYDRGRQAILLNRHPHPVHRRDIGSARLPEHQTASVR